jgi:hypothetical protein
MYKIRYHLGRGENYMHWQIVSYPNAIYLNPFQSNLILKDCTLKNNKKISERIFNGENKTVCSWITCESVDFVLNSNFDKRDYTRIFYNPRKAPYWTDVDENDIDGTRFDFIRSIGKDLYAIRTPVKNEARGLIEEFMV